MTLLLDVPVEVGVARREVAGAKPDRFESVSGGFHARVAAGFLALAAAEPESGVVIDGTQDVAEVSRLALDAVTERLGPMQP